MLVAGMFAAIFTYSQSNTEEIDLIQSIYGIEKKAIVEEFVQPVVENRVPFWEVYDAYELERKALGKERLELLVEFGEKFESCLDEKGYQPFKASG